MSSTQVTDCSCPKCGKSFPKPIELTIRTEGSDETYHACPHCFTRVSLDDKSVKKPESPSDKLEKRQGKVPPTVPKDEGKDEKIKPAGCAHFIGYLKTRPKNTPIPDDCLLCAAIMECM